MRLKRLPALVLALLTAGGTVLLAACDTTTSVQMQGAARSYDAVPTTDGSAYTLVEGAAPAIEDSASAWIGREGGLVFLAGGFEAGQPMVHGVRVPQGAVSKPTLFTVTRLGGNQVGVRLEARAPSRNGSWTDVGTAGFRQPVYLYMTYAWAANVTDPSRLVILYDPENGDAHQRMQSQWLSNGRFVIAELQHFSKYVMAVH